MTSNHSFRCSTCNSVLLFSPSQGGLRCTHCQAVEVPKKSTLAVSERDLLAQLSSHHRADGPTLAELPKSQSARCKECGATVVFPAHITARVCAFCGSPSVLPQKDPTQSLRPESIIPFSVDKQKAKALMGTWARSLRFRPADLIRASQAERLIGIYIPHFTFDAHVDSSWTAKAGFDYSETEEYEETVDGQTVRKTREVRKIRWEDRSGTRSDDYDDLLICAGRGLPPGLADSVSNFQTRALVPYAPDYLAGFFAEDLAMGLAEGWKRGESSIRWLQERRCAFDVGGDHQADLRVESSLSNLTYKAVLLPFWLATYRYRERSYRVLINGQTGRIDGESPKSFAKVGLWLVLLVLAAVVLYGLWTTYF